MAPDVLRLKVSVAIAACRPEVIEISITRMLSDYGMDENIIALSVLRDLIAAYAGEAA